MKKILSTLLLATFSLTSVAGDITAAATYVGPIQGVGLGFFGQVGIGLPSGQTCHGQRVAVLQTSNPKYKEILATMLLAEATKQSVSIYMLGTTTVTFSAGYTYCVINEGGLGAFPLWPAS